MSKLDEIFANKRTEIRRDRAAVPLAEMAAQAGATPHPRDLIAALRAAPARPALIAEIKRGSPSRGLLAHDFDPLRLARTYAENGAAAISVLTDERYFGGSLAHLRAVAELQRGQAQGLPLLRKDFICDPYQVYQARAAGADAVLLIAAALPPVLLAELHGLARDLGMAALVEVHTAEELDAALAINPALVGINNRDLHSFTVSLETVERLAPHVPAGVCVVAESGIHTPEDVARVRAVGVDAILVGEALVTAADVGARVRSLSQNEKQASMKVKICGITTLDDGLAAIEAGADMLGFNFYPPSPRYIPQAACAQLITDLRKRGACAATVGVFVNATPDEIRCALSTCGLDLAQLCGDEPPEYLATLGNRAFKAIRPADPAAARTEAARYALCARSVHRSMPACLVDASAGAGRFGGTGQVGDWDAARALAAEMPILLAGGLRPDNVAAAVAAVHPWGVDVASGVESQPGRKDTVKMRTFIQAARASQRVNE